MPVAGDRLGPYEVIPPDISRIPFHIPAYDELMARMRSPGREKASTW